MELFEEYMMAFIHMSGLFAPILFISFHLFRPFLFIPVVFICITGGVLFGPFLGTIYSIVGITLSSILFYAIIGKVPKSFKRLLNLKQKIFGKQTQMTTSQVAVLRLVPFIHFHLLSICLIEITRGFKEYTKSAFFSNIPLAFVYTTLGNWVSNLSPIQITLFFITLSLLIYMLRKKEISIKWNDFFQVST